MRVALDLEEVLADTIEVATQSTDNLQHGDFDSWDLSDYTWQVYMGVSDALWRHNPLRIEPVEPNLDEYTSAIHDEVDQLDIVTARLHVDENVELWLEHHGISYDKIISTDTPKQELNYDAFIDDNPEMFGKCRLFLRHHPHNADLDDASDDQCERIHSLHEVVDYL